MKIKIKKTDIRSDNIAKVITGVQNKIFFTTHLYRNCESVYRFCIVTQNIMTYVIKELLLY